jgi:hypothetical protein
MPPAKGQAARPTVQGPNASDAERSPQNKRRRTFLFTAGCKAGRRFSAKGQSADWRPRRYRRSGGDGGQPLRADHHRPPPHPDVGRECFSQAPGSRSPACERPLPAGRLGFRGGEGVLRISPSPGLAISSHRYHNCGCFFFVGERRTGGKPP